VPGLGTLAMATTHASLCGQRLLEADVAALRLFYKFGPMRNRELREHFVYDAQTIDQADLDDLLVLAPRRSPLAPKPWLDDRPLRPFSRNI
jgi:hypothetical protein